MRLRSCGLCRKKIAQQHQAWLDALRPRTQLLAASAAPLSITASGTEDGRGPSTELADCPFHTPVFSRSSRKNFAYNQSSTLYAKHSIVTEPDGNSGWTWAQVLCIFLGRCGMCLL